MQDFKPELPQVYITLPDDGIILEYVNVIEKCMKLDRWAHFGQRSVTDSSLSATMKTTHSLSGPVELEGLEGLEGQKRGYFK